MLTTDTLSTYTSRNMFQVGALCWNLTHFFSVVAKNIILSNASSGMNIAFSVTLTIPFLCDTESKLYQDWFNAPLQDSICAANKETAGVLLP